MMLVMAVAAISASAQTDLNKWNIGVSVGTQTNLHDWNSPNGVIIGISVGKDVSPCFGVDLDLNFGFCNQKNWEKYCPYIPSQDNSLDDITAYAVGRVNLMNLFSSNKTRRVFEVEALAGAGYGRGFDVESPYGIVTGTHERTYYNDILVKFGANFNINIGETGNSVIFFSPTAEYGITPNRHGYGLDSRNAVAQIKAGYKYRF